ncbi:hypothetical protein Bca4012_038108 [Brassica carinata]
MGSTFVSYSSFFVENHEMEDCKRLIRVKELSNILKISSGIELNNLNSSHLSFSL